MTLKNQKPVEYKGVIYPSMTALAAAYGLRRDTLNLRLKKHIPLDRPLRKGALKPCEYQGRRYESLKDFARDNDIRYEDAHICIDARGRWLDEKE